MSIPIYQNSSFSNFITEEISSVQQLLDLLEKLKDVDDSEMYYTSDDVARILKISKKEAQHYMNREDFPKIEVGKGAKVNKLAFLLYNLKARPKE